MGALPMIPRKKADVSGLREVDGVRLPTVCRSKSEARDPEAEACARAYDLARQFTLRAPLTRAQMRQCFVDVRTGLLARALEANGTVTAAANDIGMDRGWFQRDFKLYAGVTPLTYLKYLEAQNDDA